MSNHTAETVKQFVGKNVKVSYWIEKGPFNKKRRLEERTGRVLRLQSFNGEDVPTNLIMTAGALKGLSNNVTAAVSIRQIEDIAKV